MEIPAEVLVHNETLGVKGAKGRLLQIGREGYYEINLAFGDRLHRVLFPVSTTVVILAAAEEATATTRDVERYGKKVPPLGRGGASWAPPALRSLRAALRRRPRITAFLVATGVGPDMTIARKCRFRLFSLYPAIFCFCLFLPSVSAAAPAPPAAPAAAFDIESLRIPHQKFVLENGLTVLVHTDHSTPIVGVNLWYHVGSSAERRGRTGFAHLFEHFFFNGSEHHKGGFREAMDDLGANNRNGTTNTDRTNFFEDVPLSGLERTLFLEADRMGFLAANLSQEMLERERGVVQNEKRQGENQPYGRVFDRVVAAMYPYSHPYSWSTIGSMEDLNAATLDDVKKWYETYYGPNHCVLSLAGDITPERALELARKYFGDIPPGPALPALESWQPRLDTDIREVLEDRVPQARVDSRVPRARLGDAGCAAIEPADRRARRLQERAARSATDLRPSARHRRRRPPGRTRTRLESWCFRRPPNPESIRRRWNARWTRWFGNSSTRD